MANAFLLSLPPRATAYGLYCGVSHRYLFLVLSCTRAHRGIRGTLKDSHSGQCWEHQTKACPLKAKDMATAHTSNLFGLQASTKPEQSTIHGCLSLIISLLIESHLYSSGALSLCIATIKQPRLREMFCMLFNRLSAMATTPGQVRQGG